MTQKFMTRRHDVDWLRALALGLLILYHLGMYYVADWGWHVKSEQQSVFLQDFMIWSNQWRMSLLFFIAGLSLALAAQTASATELIKRRWLRLGIPLLFGMWVIVPPQAYLEGVANIGLEDSYWTFWLYYINPFTDYLADHHGPIGLLTWNHLWFLPYILVYSVLVLGLGKLLPAVLTNKCLSFVSFAQILLCLLVLLVVVRVWMRPHFPTTHALLDDWYNHAAYFPVFLLGYGFVKQTDWWQNTIQLRWIFLTLGVLGYLFIYADRHGYTSVLASLYYESVGVKVLYSIIMVTNKLAWILAAVGLAGQYLRFNNNFLRYISVAVLPYYIFHQTLIVIIAVWLANYGLAAHLEASLILLITLIGCVVGYEIVKRITLLRWLFGLSIAKSRNKQLDKAYT